MDNVYAYRCTNLTAPADTWNVNHEGALWRLTDAAVTGYVEIAEDGFVNAQSVYALVRILITAAAQDSWREGSWSPYNGYPTSVCFHESRSVFAGTDGQPQSFWGSKVGNYNDFTPGVGDDDAFYYTLASGKVDLILWLASTKVLLIGTQGCEYVAKGGSDNPITPSNIDVKSEATHGSSLLQPLRIGSCILFLQTSGKKIRELAYDWQSDAYSAPDLTQLAEHLTFDGIKDMAYQQEPFSIVWCVTNAGLLLGMTYERNQKVVGWHQHPTDGTVESIAVITNDTAMEDELWAIINRTIGVNTRRFIERIDTANYTDCCLNYVEAVPVNQVWGADHLVGETVDIVGDGAVYPPAVVAADGSVILAGPAATDIEVGLPFDSRIYTLRPEVVLNGTSQGIIKHWSQIGVRVFETVGITINGKMVEFRTSDDLMDTGVGLFSGDKWMTNLGRSADARITLEQTQPLPCTVVCLMGTIDIGD
jgi:hypothetical protein